MTLKAPKTYRTPIYANLAQAEADRTNRIKLRRLNEIETAAYKANPVVIERRKLSAEWNHREQIAAKARELFKAKNDPVECPCSGRASAVHPTRAAIVAEFLRSIGAPANPLAPIGAVMSVREIEAELLAADGLKPLPLPVTDPTPDPAPVVAVEPAKRGPGRPRKFEAAPSDLDDAIVETD
jgi:hypothetical protein